MKFGQLIEYNMRNIFLEKSYTNCGSEIIPKPFSAKPKLRIFLDIFLEYFLIYFVFIVCQVEDYRT